jgi:hypothetical protein
MTDLTRYEEGKNDSVIVNEVEEYDKSCRGKRSRIVRLRNFYLAVTDYLIFTTKASNLAIRTRNSSAQKQEISSYLSDPF